MNTTQTTPFADLCAQEEALWESSVARTFRSWHLDGPGDHSIYIALYELHATTQAIREKHGRRGPSTWWNVTNSTNPGGRFSSSGPAAPINTDGNIHPNFQRGPYTPPHTPDHRNSSNDLKKISDLEAKVKSLESKLEKYRATLTLANEENDKQREDLAALNRKIQEQARALADEQKAGIAIAEQLHVRDAADYVKTNQYWCAAEEYDKLFALKGKEKNNKLKHNDVKGAREAEEAQLDYKFKFGRALAQHGSLDEAEDAFSFVRGERRRIFGDTNVERADTREAQRHLCDVLRRQGLQRKLEEAKRMYYHSAAGLDDMTSAGQILNEVNCAWILTNAVGYARMLIEIGEGSGDYEEALIRLRKVWENKHRVARRDLGVLEREMLDIGLLLHESGEHAIAAQHLRQTWVKHTAIELTMQRQTGWALALSLVCLEQFLEARTVLADLQRLGDANARLESPSKPQILALLAHTQLHLRELAAAEENAAVVFESYGVKSVFSSSKSSPSLDYSGFHHADTLIQARCKQDTGKRSTAEKSKAAREVWDAIYAAREAILRINKDQLKKHAAAGTVLADQWEKSANKRLSEPKGAKTVRKEVKDLETMVR